jgi:hypothetical protein
MKKCPAASDFGKPGAMGSPTVSLILKKAFGPLFLKHGANRDCRQERIFQKYFLPISGKKLLWTWNPVPN